MSGLPRIPPDTPPALKRFLESLREAVEVTNGSRGSPFDSNPTWQDLLDVGFLNANPELVLKTNGKSFTSKDIANWVSVNLPDWATSTINAQTPTGLVVTANVSNLLLQWDFWDSIYYGQTLVYRSTSNDLSTATQIGSTTGNTYVDNLPPPGQAYFYWIRHETKSKLKSDYNDVNGTSAGNTVGAPVISYVFDGRDAVLQWPTPASNLTIQFYKVRWGDAFESSFPEGTANANTLRVPVTWTGARRFWVQAVDVQGGLGAVSYVDVVVIAPRAATVNQTVQNNSLVLQFSATKGSLPVDKYEIRYGSSFDTGSSVFVGALTRFETAVNWTGSRTFWVVAIDTAGNYGTPTQSIFTPTLPSIVAVTPEVIDNTVLLRWTDSIATLSIAYYKIYRNGVFTTQVNGRFSPMLEPVAGTFLYGVSAVDAAGNEGAQVTASATVKQPPDFVLYSNVDSAFGGSKTNVYKDADGGLIVNLDTTETWESHFTSRSFTSIADQVAAGFPDYVIGKTTGSYQEDIDYGAVVPNTNIVMTPTVVYQPFGAVSLAPSISTGTDGSTYPNINSGLTAYSTQFRYVRYKIDFTAAATAGGLAADTKNIIKIRPLNYRLDLRMRTKEFFVSAVSTDVGGTTQDITGLFVDVQGISATVLGTTGGFAVIDFTDAGNPTQFKVYAFNTAGTRISATVGVILRGV